MAPELARPEPFVPGRSLLFADPHEHEKRLGGAFGASAGVHVLAVVLAVVIARMPRTEVYRPSPIPNYDLVFLAQPGPGGGGGGGGNLTKAPPPKLELPKPEKKAAPPLQPPKPEPPKVEEPKPEPQMNIPAQTIAAVLQPGTLEAPPLATARGSGTGPGAGTGTGTGSGSGQGSGVGSGWGDGFGEGPYRPGSGIEMPRILQEFKPQYTADAMRAKVQGIVELEAVVLPNGTVGDIQVVRSLDRTFGLDQEAIKAVKKWRFIPGTRLGQPVAIWVTIELTFTLR